LNYTSDKASSGADSHQHTLIHEAVGVQPDARIRGGSSGGFSDLATWYLSAAGVMGYDHQRHTNKPDCGFFFCYDDGAIYRMVASMLGRSDVEVGPAIYAIDLLTKNVKTGASVTPFKQHYDQGWSDDRMSLSDIDRGWGIPQSSIVAGAILVFNVTQIAWTVSGTISGYTGDGSGITVEIFRVDTGEKVLQATTAAGGTFSKTWFENTISLFASARQDSTHAGRSESGVAS
jgi:hypothetical protein